MTLDGSASSSTRDPNPSFQWSAAAGIIDDPTSAITTAAFPVGNHAVTLTVSDACGAVATCVMSVVVESAVVTPEVTVSTDTAMLRPPNHTMRPVTVTIQTSSDCIGPECAIPLLVYVTSSEPDNAPEDGDGNTTGDVHGEDGYSSPVNISSLFTDDANLEAWVATVQLRAERADSGNGRAATSGRYRVCS